MIKKIFYILLLILAASAVNAQTIKDLKAQQEKTRERLALTNRLLEENKKNAASSLDRVSLLNSQIEDRQLLIKQINDEINLVNKEIKDLNANIVKQQKEIETLKSEYAQLMYHTYIKRNSYDKLMFVLSAESLGQSYRRLRYLQEFSDYRKDQTKRIEEKAQELQAKVTELDQYKKEKEATLKNRETENVQLQREKQNQQELIVNLKKKETNLRKQLQQEQKRIDDLNNQITKLIAEENRKAKTTKEEQLISGNFEKNIGKLPWPVEKGTIVGHFGQQPHAFLQGVVVNNKGIYIQTERGTDARSVFEGVVTQRFSIPGNNNAVIVRHGNYRTVYSNLTEIYVKEGDKISTKQKIGKIYTDPEEGNKTVIYFMIYKEKELQNPERFITK